MKQLGIEILGVIVSVMAVFVLSNLTVRVLAALMKGITTSYVDSDAVVKPVASGTLG